MVKKHNDSMDLAVGPTLVCGKQSVVSDISATDKGVHLLQELHKSVYILSHPFLSTDAATRTIRGWRKGT